MGYRYRIEYTIKRVFFGLMNWCFPLIFSHMLGQEMFVDIDFHFLSHPVSWYPITIEKLDFLTEAPSTKIIDTDSEVTLEEAIEVTIENDIIDIEEHYLKYQIRSKTKKATKKKKIKKKTTNHIFDFSNQESIRFFQNIATY